MLLTTPVRNDLIELSSTAPTVIRPGDKLKIQIKTTALQSCELTGFYWKTPAVIDSKPELYEDKFPLKLEEGQGSEFTIIFATKAGEEGYGDIITGLKFKTPDGKEISVEWSAWISVFKLAMTSDTESLSFELRQRLIDVVNAKVQNGHIFLGDYLAFFKNYLNIQVPDSIADTIAEEIGLPYEGLPVDSETLILLMLGKMTFYGITRFELIAEEYCTESDDKFTVSASREVEAERMDDA